MLEKSNGLRTAVKLGEKTPEEALEFLKQEAAKGVYVKPEIVAWLQRRK